MKINKEEKTKRGTREEKIIRSRSLRSNKGNAREGKRNCQRSGRQQSDMSATRKEEKVKRNLRHTTKGGGGEN